MSSHKPNPQDDGDDDSNRTQIDDEKDSNPTQNNKVANEQVVFNQPNMANIFGFIESLSTKLPIDSPKSKQGNDMFPVRRTSDLLDTLQKALLSKPPVQKSPELNIASESLPSVDLPVVDPKTHFSVCVDIRKAVNVSKIRVCVKTKKNQSVQEQEASTYITFEAHHGSNNCKVKSPDGMVYTTQVVEHTSNPIYNSRFDVALPVELLLNVRYRVYI